MSEPAVGERSSPAGMTPKSSRVGGVPRPRDQPAARSEESPPVNRPRPALRSVLLVGAVSGALLAPLTPFSASALPAAGGLSTATIASGETPKRIKNQWIV